MTPRYKKPEEMQAAIDRYFESCKGHALRDENGDAITDKRGIPIIVDVRPPTVTGLALALGFTSRQALLNYQAKPRFVDTITRAKTRCEAYAEGRLYDREGVNGAKFSLTNNFRGWSEKQEQTSANQIADFLQAMNPKPEDIAALFANEEDSDAAE